MSNSSSSSNSSIQRTCSPGTPVAQCPTQPNNLGSLGLSGAQVLLVGLLVTLILVSVIGNCLVCVAIFTDRRLRKLGNAFIVSLAIADLFVSCLVMTFALCNDLMNRWIFGDWFCDVWISFDIMCCTASILNLCAISLDRFVHINDCLLYNQWMTRRVAISAVIIIWFISALVSFVPINLGWHKPAAGRQLSEPLEGPQASWPHLPNGSARTKLDYLQGEPIERQSSLLVDSGRSRRRAFHGSGWKRKGEGWMEGGTETGRRRGAGATQFNQVESNPLDGSQIIRRPKRASSASSDTGHRQHSDQAASKLFGGNRKTAASANHSAGQPPPPLPPEPTNLGPASGGNHQRQPPDSRQGAEEEPKQPPAQQCVLALTPTYAIVSSAISFYIPCIIMLALYTKLFACARKHVRNIQAFTKLPAPISLAPTTTNTAAADTCLVAVQEQLPEEGTAQSGSFTQSAAWQRTSFGPAHRARQIWFRLGVRRTPNSTTTTTTCTTTGAVPDSMALPDSRPFLAAAAATSDTPSGKKHLHTKQASLQQQQQAPVGQGSQLATHKAAVTLGIIMGTFLFCWVPFFCLNIIKAFCVDCIPSSLFRAFTWLGYANSALNPIIYGIHNTEFRNAFSWIFFRHLNIRKNSQRLSGGAGLANNLNNKEASNRLSSTLQPRRHRKRLGACRQNSAPQNSSGWTQNARGRELVSARKQDAADCRHQVHLRLAEQPNNQCSTSPEL